ncbi:hypothetical protein NtRootA9_33660 [Arthrobacter sp. NtRootA9]|nr:hypothetical protein NtRootA9_33660 [Arthrobacter sp. NtRootA9]
MAQSYHSTALPMPVPTMVLAVDMRPVCCLVTAMDMVTSWGSVGCGCRAAAMPAGYVADRAASREMASSA